MALAAVGNWLSYVSSNIEATFAFFGFYSKLEYAKAQALKELEDEYGLPASEVLKYEDDSDNSMADEEEVAGDWNPEFEDDKFETYEDELYDCNERSYEGFEFSDDEHLSEDEDENLTVDEEEDTNV